MKPSTSYSIGDTVTVMGRVFTKEQSGDEKPDGKPHSIEIWRGDNGLEYLPSLMFTKGLCEPMFNQLHSE